MKSYLLKLLPPIVAICFCAGANQSFAQMSNSKINLAPCVITGIDKPAQCGKFSVFENRRTRKGRRIELNIVVFPAQEANRAPDPIFGIAGGPGQSAAAPVVAANFFRELEPVNRQRDIVLIDQRGTGGSNPLNCRIDTLKEAINYLSGNYSIENWKACRQELEKKADLRLYTTPIAMDDLDDVREALGYKQINLFGGSYGSRAALVYLRQHPTSVRSVVLRAPINTDGKLPLYVSRDGQRALDKLFDDCAADAKCSRAYPNLRQTFNSILARLEAAPANAKAKDPRGGTETELQITRDLFAAGAFFMLYSSDFSRHLPLIISNASKGNYTTFVSVAVQLGVGLMSQVNVGMYLSILCAEDVPRIKFSVIERETKNTFLGSKNTLNAIQICKNWARGKVSSDYFKPVVSKSPVLIISGEVDPVLPPRWGAGIAESLPNSRHIIIPGVAHGPSFPGCVKDLVASFINDASGAALDLSCVSAIHRPDFTVPPPVPAAQPSGNAH